MSFNHFGKKKSSYVILISITNLGKLCLGNCGSLKKKKKKLQNFLKVSAPECIAMFSLKVIFPYVSFIE